jgi:hypothetical protein
MLMKRTVLWLGTVSLILAVGLPALAQDLAGLQLFAPVETAPYGRGPQPNEGYFFVWDGLNWYTSSPNVATVGFEGLTRTVFYGPHPIDEQDLLSDAVIQSNSLNTSALRTLRTSGDRFELGRVRGQHGWMVSTFHLKPQTQFLYGSDVIMTFVDDEFGPLGKKLLEGIVGDDGEEPAVDIIRDLPLTFEDVKIRNSVTTWSVELMYIHRSKQRHNGGFFEWFGGVRYMELNEKFDVDAKGTPAGEAEEGEVVSILADSAWYTQADNHIIGPQVGLRWFRKRGRLMLSTEGRFFAGYNSQTVRQHGVLGDKLTPPGEEFEPSVMGPTYFNSVLHIEEWSPCAELRADLRFQVTRSVSLRAGWTGTWVDGIARPSAMVNYEVAYMGINGAGNHQDVFINGLTLGIDVNR